MGIKENLRKASTECGFPVNDFVAPPDPTQFHMPTLTTEAEVRDWELSLMARLPKPPDHDCASRRDALIEKVRGDRVAILNNPRRQKSHADLRHD